MDFKSINRVGLSALSHSANGDIAVVGDTDGDVRLIDISDYYQYKKEEKPNRKLDIVEIESWKAHLTRVTRYFTDFKMKK